METCEASESAPAETTEPERRTEPRRRLKTRDEVDTETAVPVSEVLPPRPKVVALGGREFRFRRLTFNDLLAAEAQGIELGATLAGLGALKLTAVRDFAWVMLQQTEPEISVHEVGELLPVAEGELAELIGLMAEASLLSGKAGPPEAAAGG